MGLLALLALLRGPALMSAAWGNAGMLALRDALLARVGRLPAVDAGKGMAQGEGAVSLAIQRLRRAVALDQENLVARRALGRAALVAGDAERAADIFDPLLESAGRDPLLYRDVLIALSASGRSDDLLAFYEAVAPPSSYSNDLYASYLLWRVAGDAMDVDGAAVYSETLTSFSLEAVHSIAEPTLENAAEGVLGLLEDGIWDREKALNVVSFLVWQHDGAASVVRLLEQLAERYPVEPDWLFYLAEAYHRRGELEQAAAMYQRVLTVDSKYAPAYLRLGMVAEAQAQALNVGSELPAVVSQEHLQEAARWYAQYQRLAADDLLGLKRLATVCGALEEAGTDAESCYQAALWVSGSTSSRVEMGRGASSVGLETSAADVLREAIDARSNDRRIVADMLVVPVEAVGLGVDLVENGGFEAWVEGTPEGWIWSDMFNREPFNAAAFLGGRDEIYVFEGQRAARVDGFWVQQEEGKSPARAGFWQRGGVPSGSWPVTLAADAAYVLSLDYRTTRIPDNGASVWVSGTSDLFWKGDHGLPGTDGAWWHFVAVGWNRSAADAEIYPLIRIFAPGSVEIDDVQVRVVRLDQGITVNPGSARFRVVTGDN